MRRPRFAELGLAAALSMGVSEAKQEVPAAKMETRTQKTSPLQEVFDRLAPQERQAVFQAAEAREADCIDERAAPGSVRLPGAGILMESVDAAADALHHKGVRVIDAHEGCGAAALATQQIEEKLQADPGFKAPTWFKPADPEGNAQRFVNAVASRMNEKYQVGAQAKYLTFENGGMKGDHHAHKAEVIYYDRTGQDFNRYGAPDKLPLGFTVTALEAKTDVASIVLAAKIAFGSHGQPQAYTAEHPLRVEVLATTPTELSEVIKQTRDALGRAIPQATDKIIVEGVVVTAKTM